MTSDGSSQEQTNNIAPSWVVWLLSSLAACLTVALIAIVVFEVITKPDPTIPDPGPVPVNESSLHLAPARVIAESKVIRVGFVDRDRFVATLKKDVLAHGGWTQDPENAKSPKIVAVVPEAYLERIDPLLQAGDPDGLHPNYVSWAKSAAAGPEELADSAPVQVTVLVFKETELFSRKPLPKLFQWTLFLWIPIVALVISITMSKGEG